MKLKLNDNQRALVRYRIDAARNRAEYEFQIPDSSVDYAEGTTEDVVTKVKKTKVKKAE